MKIDTVLGLNFKYSGALVDANRLIARGWRDMTGVSDSGEWFRYNSTWIEYVETLEGREYRIQCSLGATIVSKKENGFMKQADNDFVREAHELKVPRKAFLRRVHAWVCDNEAMIYKDAKGVVPTAITLRVAADLAEAVVEPARLFVDDIAYQTVGLEENAPDRKGNPIDQQFYILASVIAQELKRAGIESIGCLLAPFARAVLTDEDAAGREYALGITDPKVVEMVADWAKASGFYAASVALLPIATREEMRGHITPSTWTAIAYSAAAVGAFEEFVQAMEHVFASVRMLDDKKARAKFCASIYWMVVGIGNDCKGDADGFALIAESFARNIDLYGKDLAPRLWAAVARCHVCQKEGEDIPADRISVIMEVLSDAIHAYDDEHKDAIEKKPFLKNLAPGVKAPLEWQAFLFSATGSAGRVLQTFPNPVSFDIASYHYLPTIEPVEGLSFVDVWGGFVAEPWDDAVYNKVLESTMKGLKGGRSFDATAGVSWLAVNHDLESYQLLEPEKPDVSEVSVVSILAKVKGEERPTLAASFPYLPKEYSGNRSNAIVKVWRYRIWERGQAADVEFETDSGDRLTAVMPYFVADYHQIARGDRMEAMMVGFANEIRKGTIPNHPESFTVNEGPLAEDHGGPVTIHLGDTAFDFLAQDTFPEEISHAGFGIQGRIKSMREIEAFGKAVLVFEVESTRLENPLRVYIAKERVKETLAVGETVEVYGWLYLDVFNSVGKFDDYKAVYPVCGPKPEPEDPLASGVPTYVRTEYTDEERKTKNSEIFDSDWYGYGRRVLERCSGVTRVEDCPGNPLCAHYLVRLNGKVVKYRMVMANEGEKPCVDYPGVEVFVLRLKPAKRGVNLSWERLPGEGKEDGNA